MEQQSGLIFPVEKMHGEFDDFIGIWDNFFPSQLCDDIILECDKIWKESSRIDCGKGQFPNKKLGRSDWQFILSDHESEMSKQAREYIKCCISHYMHEYNQLLNVKLMTHVIKFQKTPPGGGYHEWHYETSSYFAASRELVWTVYLNTMPEGEAETEFFYQKRRIKPVKGRVAIWPAGLTHVHRGNTVFTQDKYIITGWVHKII